MSVRFGSSIPRSRKVCRCSRWPGISQRFHPSQWSLYWVVWLQLLGLRLSIACRTVAVSRLTRLFITGWPFYGSDVDANCDCILDPSGLWLFACWWDNSKTRKVLCIRGMVENTVKDRWVEECKTMRYQCDCAWLFIYDLILCLFVIGDSRKLPGDADTLSERMMLRIAYMIVLHNIPWRLIVNVDHFAAHYTPQKVCSFSLLHLTCEFSGEILVH